MKLQLHKHMTNEEISDVFEFISELLKAEGANRFRVSAYENAAATIKIYPKQLHEMFLSDPDFNDIPAVGKTLNEKLVELFTTGNIKALQKYVTDVPDGVYPLVKVHGIGGKRALFLATHFNLNEEKTALKTLLEHAKAGDIQNLPGFGEKSEQDIIEQLEHHQEKPRMTHEAAQAIADKLMGLLKQCEDIVTVETLGSLRRGTPTVGDVDLGIAVKDMGRVKNYVKTMDSVRNITVEGEGLIRIFLTDGTQVDIKVSSPVEWGAFIQHFTGSKEHNIKLREFALEQGKSLSEHGIKITDDISGEKIVKIFADEKDFYNDLGLEWIPPEERVGKDEIKRYQMK
jgi:DNA polymerase (family X)